MNYYNEYDPNAAAWLRELISYGAIPNGHVDTRSIRDVQPSDLSGYTQCHFFAGIGGWSYALRLAGWPEDRPVWTGSCPCQPFSSAGKQRGTADERHLWPEFFRLIRECGPATIFGEQVASPVALDWLDTVSADLEGEGYAVGAADLCAAGIGAPHIRQRLYWVADSASERRQHEPQVRRIYGAVDGEAKRGERTGCCGDAGSMADSMHAGRAERWAFSGDRQAAGSGCSSGLGDSIKPILEGHRSGPATKTRWDGAVRPVAQAGESCGVADAAGQQEHEEQHRPAADERGWCADKFGGRSVADAGQRTHPTNGFWRDPDWLLCRDGKWRPVESEPEPLADGVSAILDCLRSAGVDAGTVVKSFPLANKFPGRTWLLRGYGNAITIPVAVSFISAYLGVHESSI